MGKCKTKAIQSDLFTFRHNEAYSKPYINLTYSEPWYIQDPDIFKTRNIFSKNPGIFRTQVYCNSGIFKTQDLFSHLRCQASTIKRFLKTVKGK